MPLCDQMWLLCDQMMPLCDPMMSLSDPMMSLSKQMASLLCIAHRFASSSLLIEFKSKADLGELEDVNHHAAVCTTYSSTTDCNT